MQPLSWTQFPHRLAQMRVRDGAQHFEVLLQLVVLLKMGSSVWRGRQVEYFC